MGSGWDQKYDLQDWARDVQKQAEDLQRHNKACRYIYLTGAAISFTLGIVFASPLSIASGVFCSAVFAWNEHLIRKLKDAGVK